MDFFLFVLLNAALFIRPAELVPALIGVPVFEILILATTAASIGGVLVQLDGTNLGKQPISVCVIGILAMVVISMLARLDFWSARMLGLDFAKVVLYYMLLIATINTPARLRSFLNWLTIFIIALAILSLVHFHGLATIPALEALERGEYNQETGETDFILQLRSSGLYNDPNDFCLILVVGIILCLCKLFDTRAGLARVLWMGPAALLVYSLMLTQSRGGLLGLMAALFILFAAKFGWRKAIPIGAIVLPGIFMVAGGRQVQISTGQDTAQQRIQLWMEGFQHFFRSPVTGIGAGQFVEEMGLVAHNSFVHSYVELGFLGGTFFLATFYLSYWSLVRLGRRDLDFLDADFIRLRPFLQAILIGYAVGLLSISRCYIMPTYMIIGIVVAYAKLVSESTSEAIFKINMRLIGNVTVVSVCVVVGLYLFARYTVSYG